MHELSLATNIVRIVREEMTSRGVDAAVKEVSIRMGRLNAVIPDILTFNFDVLKKDDPTLSGASLVIEEVPILVRCKVCGDRSEIEEPVFLCPACGGAVSVESGQEMWVEGVSFEDD